MAILFLVEVADGKVKKASLKQLLMPAKLQTKNRQKAVGLALGTIDDASLSALGIYGTKNPPRKQCRI